MTRKRRPAKRAFIRKGKSTAASPRASTAARSKGRSSSKRIARLTDIRLDDADAWDDYPHSLYERSYQT